MSVHAGFSPFGLKSHQYHDPKVLPREMATRKMLLPPDAMYCRIQIQMSRVGSSSTTWSQQNPPAAEGSAVNGSTSVKLAPPVVLRLANQLPVTKTLLPDAAAVGSSTLEVWTLVAASPSAMFWIKRTAAMVSSSSWNLDRFSPRAVGSGD